MPVPQDRFEELMKKAFNSWKSSSLREYAAHPDEETLACFFEGRLTPKEEEEVERHLLTCAHCAEVSLVQSRLRTPEGLDVPEELVSHIKALVPPASTVAVLEILIRLAQGALEIIGTTGDVLVGQELVPAPILRSRDIRHFKDEITVLKDFESVLVEVRIEYKQGSAFRISVAAKEKGSQQPKKGVRIALLKEGLELESYAVDKEATCFENVAAGTYRIEIATSRVKLASVLLPINT